MKNLYYVVHPQLQDVGSGIKETTGWRTITVYDIDTQSMHIVEVGQFEARDGRTDEYEIQTWLDNSGQDEVEYNLIKL